MAETKQLFDAYKKGALPQNHGYILTVTYDKQSAYTKFEIISYGNVKDIYSNEEGITFQADGRKVFILFEPVSYPAKHTEPCYRDDKHKIPYRFKELKIYTTRRQNKILIGEEPVDTYTAFTILNPTSLNVSYVISGDDKEDIAQEIMQFIYQALWKDMNVSRGDAKNAVNLFGEVMPKLLTPHGLVE